MAPYTDQNKFSLDTELQESVSTGIKHIQKSTFLSLQENKNAKYINRGRSIDIKHEEILILKNKAWSVKPKKSINTS